MIRRSVDGIELVISVSEATGDRSTVTTSRDRYSGGRYYDSIRVSVNAPRTITPSQLPLEVAKAMAARLQVPEQAVQHIAPTKKYGQHAVLIKGLSARELATLLG
jgi:hypothetical protein